MSVICDFATPTSTDQVFVCNYVFYGFELEMENVNLFKEAVLRVKFKYLCNNDVNQSFFYCENLLNNTTDGEYRYLILRVYLPPDIYGSWGLDDSYIIHYIQNNMKTLLNLPDLVVPQVSPVNVSA